MAVKRLSKEKVADALGELSKFRLIAPAKSDDVVVFKQISDPAEACLDYGNSTVPPKKFAFPQTETLFRFVTGSPELEEKNVEEEGTTIIFGLRPCDARAMAIVDKLFAWDFDDPYYLKRRELTTLVGMACVEPPSVNCFCTSLGGSPFGTEGLDLLLTDMGDHYLVQALTEKGKKLVETLSSQLEDAAADDEKKAKEMALASEGKIRRSIATEGIPEKLPGLWENELWKKVSAACLGCGICTFLCPTCHCFDIQDEVTGEGGVRFRCWDTCQFGEFTRMGAGHNPRPTQTERLRQRVSHKFKYLVEEFGRMGCTGCGRCVEACPVNIDIRSVLREIEGGE